MATGALILVGPSDALVGRVRELADQLGTPVVEWEPKPEETAVITVELDPLGEVRVDDEVAIAFRARHERLNER